MWVSMTKDVNASEVVVPSYRAGMKREFAMMMKAQSEMGRELSMGRRRMRSQNTGSSGKDNVGSCGKRMKKEDGEKSGRKDMRKVNDEADSGLVDVWIDVGGDLRSLESEKVGEGRNEGGDMMPDSKGGSVHPLCTEAGAGGPVLSGGTGTSTSHLSKSKKVELKKVPMKLRDLLEIGLLDGLPVCYIRGSKAQEQPDSELRGFIRGTGILCSCKECKGEKVVTPNLFELHAGSGNKRPPEHIYLENGKNLRDVLNACRVVHSDSLEVVIRNFIGRADLRLPASCLKCKGLIRDISGKKSMLLCGACVGPKESGSFPTQMSRATYRLMSEKDKQPELEFKPKSNDIVWDYGVLYNKDKRYWMTCKLCKRIIKGGVYRLKNHIAGIVGQVEACPKASDEDKKRVRAYLENNKNKKRQRVEELQEKRVEVNIGVDEEDDDCQVVGNSSRKKSKDLRPIEKLTSAIDPTKSRQQNINDTLKLKFTNDVHEYVARWIYETGIPFHAIDNQSFRQLVDAVGQFGPGYKPPSQYLLREPLLKQEVERTKLSLKKHEEEWMKNGCSIMTDAWTDRERRNIMNICVNCKLGTSFLCSIEESMEAHTGVYIFEFVEKYIIEIGSQHVVQVVTDNATNNMAAADLLKVTQPQIFWTSCATHTINLMLEAIGKLSMFSGMLEKSKALTIFIYAHHRTLALMRKYIKKRDIVRPGVTKFATSFLTLESLKDKKDQLRRMFTSEEWSKTKLKSSVKGKMAEAMVTSMSFWNGVSLALNVFTPLVKVLRLVDVDKKPSMAFLLGALKQAKEEIRKSFKKEENATHILKIINDKSKGRLDSPLHYAAYLLNPVFYFKDSSISNDTNVMNGFLNCVEIIFPTDDEMQSTIANDELLKYKSKFGNFGRKMAVMAYEKVDVYHDFDPVGWWSNYGGETPNLQKMAMRFLSLTSSSSGCERNWSHFEGIHNKKRNGLETSRLNDLVYVKFNANLMKKKSKREMGGDSLLSSQASEVQGWLIDGGDEDQVELGSGLTWKMVEEASGVDEVLQPRRSARNIPIRELDEDLDISEEENEEDDFESDVERIMNVVDGAYVYDLED